jgi:hypothetical protein
MFFWQEQLKNFLLSYIFSSLVYLCKFFFRHITQAIHTILSFCDGILLGCVVFSDFYVFFTENGESFSFVLERLVFFVKAKKLKNMVEPLLLGRSGREGIYQVCKAQV